MKKGKLSRKYYYLQYADGLHFICEFCDCPDVLPKMKNCPKCKIELNWDDDILKFINRGEYGISQKPFSKPVLVVPRTLVGAIKKFWGKSVDVYESENMKPISR